MKLSVIIKAMLGFLALGMAFVGLFLPIWPTTPFVLLSIGCFSATPQLQNKLLRISWIREYYESYTAGKGVCKRTVAISLSFLWGMLFLSMVIVQKTWLILLLIAVGVAVTIHIRWVSRRRIPKKVLLKENKE